MAKRAPAKRPRKAPKRARGRPTNFDAEKAAKILTIVEQTVGTIRGASREVGVGESTVRDWLKVGLRGDGRTTKAMRDWAAKMEGALDRAQTKLRGQMIALGQGRTIRGGRVVDPGPEDVPLMGIQMKATVWLLEHRWPKQFGPQAVPEDAGQDTPAIIIDNADDP